MAALPSARKCKLADDRIGVNDRSLNLNTERRRDNHESMQKCIFRIEKENKESSYVSRTMIILDESFSMKVLRSNISIDVACISSGRILRSNICACHVICIL